MFSLKSFLAAFVFIPFVASASSSALAVEDFRRAIKSIVPHLVLVRQQRTEEPEKELEESQGTAVKNSNEQVSGGNSSERRSSTRQASAIQAVVPEQSTASAALIDLISSRRPASESFQHAFRVADDLIATIDLDGNLGGPEVGSRRRANSSSAEGAAPNWQLLTRDGKWHEIELAGFDKVSRLVILRAPVTLLDKIASGAPIGDSVPVGHWVDGKLEMGLPTVVVWYEDGAPRAKATMIAATGNAMTRGLAALDFEFAPTQVGSPVLDAEGRLLGLVAMERSWRNANELERRFELKEAELPNLNGGEGNEPAQAIKTDVEPSPTTIIISGAARDEENKADLIVPVNILNRLVEDVGSRDELVVLDFGLIGVRLGNGDATIRRVITGGAAAEKDCEAGDRIVSINGQNVRNDGDIFNLVASYRAGDTLTLELVSSAKSKPEASSSDDGANETATGETATGPEQTQHRKVEITMRGIRTRSSVAPSNSEESRIDGSSWLDLSPQLQQTRLVGVAHSTQASASEAKSSEQLHEEIVRLRTEIDALLEALNKEEQQY